MAELEEELAIANEFKELYLKEITSLETQLEEHKKLILDLKVQLETRWASGFYLVDHSSTNWLMKIGEHPEPINYARISLDEVKLKSLLDRSTDLDNEQLSKTIIYWLSNINK